MSHVAEICRYPVKGLSAERLERVAVTVAGGLPGDRAYAIAHASTQFDPAAPKFLPKTSFLQLMQNEKLATLRTEFDPESETLTILREGRQVARGNLSMPIGRNLIEQFIAAFMKDDLRGAPHIVTAPGHQFSDCGKNVLSLINLATLKDMERVARDPIHPLRFRGNLYVEDMEPWAEFALAGAELRIGGALLRGAGRIDRCGATNVDPDNGARNMQIPKLLQAGFGHIDCGIYLEVLEDGEIAAGDTIRPV